MATRTATSKPADDQPFDFNLDAVQSEVELRSWRVHFDGQRWEFAHLQALDCWDLVEAAEGGEISAVMGSMKLALGDQWEAFRKIGLPQYKLMPLFKAWRAFCGLEPGESEASGS
ncbi:hypothetical protein [Streptomyces goshikiensis]|uniref:hypothetical protein n=1 Tax=Streptomyces goshikiensis TaxID=1942 RepID=UPI002E11C087|nr:hypothetical protein OG224_06650 [Streptomyces goshikiensis]